MSTDTSDDGYELTAADRFDRADMELRHQLARALGDSLDEDNDLYETFNWDKNPSVERFYAQYLRNPYSRAVVDIPAKTTWRDRPDIVDDAENGGEGETETRFEDEVASLADENRLWHYCKRADTLAGIGEFGILVLEFDDIDSPDGFRGEVTSASELTGLRPFSQASVDEIEVGGPGSDRWGEPVEYKLDLEDEDDDFEHRGPSELWVHHSRVVHVPSDGLLDDEIRGTPRQEPVFNNLCDIEKSLGSAAELAYRASAWGLNVNIDPEYELEDGGDDLREHLNRWYYGLEPILRTQGAQDVQSLGGEEIDPSNIIDPNVEAISAQTGIPQSVLKGNETGERATTQDLKEWYGKVAERREEFITPLLVRELIDRLIDLDVLPEPRGEDYLVEWPPLHETSEDEIAGIEKSRAEVMEILGDLLDRQQRIDYLRDGDLPTEVEEYAEDEVPEADLQEQFEQMQQQMGPAQGPTEEPPEAPPADDD